MTAQSLSSLSSVPQLGMPVPMPPQGDLGVELQRRSPAVVGA
ncbi:MAG: hypothetical protein R2873_26805 [Caldilineaceae bacterium]